MCIYNTEMKDVAVIILTKNNSSMFKECVDSIFTHTKNVNVKLYIGDTGSTDDQFQLYKDILKKYKSNIKQYIKLGEYHFAKNHNWIIQNLVDEDHILFCNDDIVLKNNSVSKMLDKLGDNIGTVGCKLLYPDMTIQHAGHLHIKPNDSANINGYNVTHKFLKHQDKHIETCIVDGNTFAFCLVNRQTFLKVGRLNELYSNCFEDVGFCLSCSRTNFKHICVGDAICLHHESVSRKKTGTYISQRDVDLIRHDLYTYYKFKK